MRSILALTLGLAATGAVAAERPWQTPVIDGKDWRFPVDESGQAPLLRVIPTNRWIWVETTHGIFAPQQNLPSPGTPTRTESERQREMADGLDALFRLSELSLQNPDSGRVWCIDWQTAGGAPRLACME